MQCVGDENFGHHVLETGNHDMQQVESVHHAQGQGLIAEQLNTDMDHPVAECIWVSGAF